MEEARLGGPGATSSANNKSIGKFHYPQELGDARFPNMVNFYI